MVDPRILLLDSASVVVSLALPGGVWAMLFLLAWEHPRFAESVGFGRKVFWLLLPGALLASFALLPFVPVATDWVAVSFAGALFPLGVAGLALRRIAPPARRAAGYLVAMLGVESAAMISVVLPADAGALRRVGRLAHLDPNGAAILLVGSIGLAASAAALATLRRSPDRSERRTGFLFALTTAVLWLTFAGSSAIPGVGIVESFPYFLLPPLLAGIAAGLLAPVVFPREEALALPASYLTATVGVLLGADLLREPPLYGNGPPGLYAIGGAGVLDLVYLSGLLALAGAALTHTAFERGWVPVGPSAIEAPTSALRELREGFRAGVRGDLGASLSHSVAATRAAASQARRLLGAGPPPTPGDRPWEGLPVPGWVVADQANLDRVARSGTTDPREGYRAWLTARWLTLAGRTIALGRFASLGERLAAFAVDLAVVTVPALLLFAAIARATPGGFDALVLGLPLNAAIVGAVSAALLYRTASEAYTGTTLGKRLLHLGVRDRSLQPPDGISALVRNVPLAPIFTLVSLGGALALAVAMKGIGPAGAIVLGVSVPGGVLTGLGIAAFVSAGTALLGSIGILVIALTWERQRVGDLWADTWVVRTVTPSPKDPEPSRVPPGPGRSG